MQGAFMFTSSTQPQSIFAVLGNSCRLYKTTFLKLLPFSFIYAALITIPELFFHLDLQVTAAHRTQQALNAGLFLVFLIIQLLTLWMTAIMIRIGGCEMGSIPDCQGNYMGYSARKFLIYFITSMIFLFMALIGTIFLLLPGIFLYILFMFYFAAIMLDNYDVIGSLKLSAQLVWGNWWRTFIIALIAFIIVALVFIFFEAVIDLPVIFLTRFPPGEVGILSHVVGLILMAIFTPWLVTVMLCQYHDLKLRHQAKM